MRTLRRLALLFAAAFAVNASVTVTSTVYGPDPSTFATGQIQISWPAFVAGDGHFVAAGSKLYALAPMGQFSAVLEPNDVMTPLGTLYVVQYRINGGPSPFPVEYWSCPSSASPLTIPDCRTTSTAQPSGIVNISQLQPVGPAGTCLVSTGTSWRASTCNATLTDIRLYGAVCNGTDQNTAVQAAISGGALRIFIPSGCTWIAPSGIIPGGVNGLTFVGENATTSIIKSSASPSGLLLQVAPGVAIESMNLEGSGCTLIPNCQIQQMVNVSTLTVPVITTGRSSFDSFSGQDNVDRSGAFFKVAVTPTGNSGDAANFSNCSGGFSPPCLFSGNALRADTYAGVGGLAAILATAMPGAASSAQVVTIENMTGGSPTSPTLLSFFDQFRTANPMVQFNHRATTYTGNVIQMDLADVSGTFTGNFMALTNGGTGNVKYRIDSQGNIIGTGYSAHAGALITLVNGANQNIAVGNTGFLKVTGPTSTFSLGGLVNTGGIDGRTLVIINETAQTMIVTNQDAGSTAANRIFVPGGADYTCPTTFCIVELIYDGSTAQWVLQLGGSSGGGSGAILTALGTITTSPPIAGGSGTVLTITATLGANITCGTISGFTPGQLLTLKLKQDGTGGRTFTCSDMADLGTVSGVIGKTDVQTFYAATASTLQAVGPMWCFDCAPGIVLPGSASGSTFVQGLANASGTITVPSATDTLIAKATTDTLTNKTFDTAGTGNSFKIAGTGITGLSGSGGTLCTSSGSACAGGSGTFAVSQGRQTGVAMTGSPVTLWSMGTIPALVAGACYEFKGIVQTGTNNITLTIVLDGTTTISTPFSATGAGGYTLVWDTFYCNDPGVQNTQNLNPWNGFYFPPGLYIGSGGASSLLGESPNTPTAVDWSMTHTLVVKATATAGGTVTPYSFKIN